MAIITRYILILLLFLQSSCTDKKQGSFTFVQLCDTQLGHGGYEHDLKSFKMSVKQINKLNADFVIMCGDLVQDRNDKSFSDFKEIIEDLKIPIYIVPGNHDIGAVPNTKTLNYYRKTIGDDYYKFQHKEYSFIFTNSLLWRNNLENESDKHDNWFKESIKNKSVNKFPVFVIGHYPLYTRTVNEEKSNSNLPRDKRKEILNLFEENNVVAYLSGHTHRKVINKYKNIQLVSGVSTSKNSRNSPLGFRVWNVSLDSITNHFIPLQISINE